MLHFLQNHNWVWYYFHLLSNEFNHHPEIYYKLYQFSMVTCVLFWKVIVIWACVKNVSNTSEILSEIIVPSHLNLVLPFKFINLYLGRVKWPLHLETRARIQKIWNAILANIEIRMYRFIPFCHWSVSISFKHFSGHSLQRTFLVVNRKED